MTLKALRLNPPPPPASQKTNSPVTAATIFWWIPPLWPAAITFAATVWLCGGNLPVRMNAQSVAKSGKAFLKSTSCWGMLLAARPYQGLIILTWLYLHFSYAHKRKQLFTSTTFKWNKQINIPSPHLYLLWCSIFHFHIHRTCQLNSLSWRDATDKLFSGVVQKRRAEIQANPKTSQSLLAFQRYWRII